MRCPTGLTFVMLCAAGCMHRSPGVLHESSTAPLTPLQAELREELRADVETLSREIGPRHAGTSMAKILESERWIVSRLDAHGLEARRIEVDLGGTSVGNIETTFAGTQHPEEVIVIGAHYDTVPGSPGADDNASGVALLLATARRLGDAPLGRTVRLVFFVNEEHPFTGGLQMGSRVYAERCRADGDDIVAMIGVDSVGVFSSEPGSQRYPPFILGLPTRGNFVAFSSNRENTPLLDRVVATFQSCSSFPSIGVASDSKDAARGDHAPFWWQGYPAISMSDTSEYRDPNYHRPTDVATNLDYDEMARLAEGFIATIRALVDVRMPLP